MTIRPPYYPIIYLRGYAATMAEIEETAATPYMGFNLGSTKLRQNYDNEIVRFIFESPLIRLMKDEEYVDAYGGGDFIPRHESVPAKSVWVFRYYEPVSKDLGTGERQIVPEFAKQLRAFILRVREQVCGNDVEERRKFKVYLVAHSLGGLVCRCYLQNICRHEQNDDLELPGDSLVDKVFTYATPHNGIDLAGFNAPDLGALDKLHVRNFNREHMRTYLRIDDSSRRASSLDGAFPPERFFCFVGTNYKDYDAFYKLSKRASGPMSDGLVMMNNAAVDKAPRAFAYRSHSGHYGIVNSEEGYQNLRRFLFGDVRVDARLAADEITLPPLVQEAKDEGKLIRAQYNIEAAAKVRGAGYFLNERRVSQESAIRRKYEDIVEQHKSVYLFTGYLLRDAKAENSRDTALAFALTIAIQVPLFEVDRRFWFDEHYEGARLIFETVTIHVRRTSARTTVKYGLASEAGAGQANRSADIGKPNANGVMRLEIPLGFNEGAARPPRPGFRGRLLLSVQPWNAPS